ncbi:MAG: hypothetical protein ACSHWQ_01445 [Spongiibacteraceae bacterium]
MTDKSFTESAIQAVRDHGPISSSAVAELMGELPSKVSSVLSCAVRYGDLHGDGKYPMLYSAPSETAWKLTTKRWVPGELVL